MLDVIRDGSPLASAFCGILDRDRKVGKSQNSRVKQGPSVLFPPPADIKDDETTVTSMGAEWSNSIKYVSSIRFELLLQAIIARFPGSNNGL